MAPSRFGLDWLLAISGIFSVFLAIIYLFYSNRILAAIIGYALRLNWWRDESSRAWVSLESFQVSLLAGRLLIKDLKYHSSNQEFRAVKCRITWRYWMWSTRVNDNRNARKTQNKGNLKSSSLPCRIQISLEGVEWLLYNRTSAYNNILTQLRAKEDIEIVNGRRPLVSGGSHDPAPFASNSHSKTNFMKDSDTFPPRIPTPPVRTQSPLAWFGKLFSAWFEACKPDFRELLPVDITANHGAIVCGNPSTPSLFVARFSRVNGGYNIGTSRSSYDLYKTMIDLEFENVKIDLEKNPKYRGSLVQQGKVVLKRFEPDSANFKLSYPGFAKLWTEEKRRETQLRTEDTYARTQANEYESDQDYAIVGTIFEAPSFKLSYYWDEPGEVPAIKTAGLEGSESHDIGNGDLAPQYGIDCIVYGGIVRYGPWSDRQRVELQRLFFPPTYQNAEQAVLLRPGDKRLHTELKIFFELHDTTTFHIPFKESSKDWQFSEARFPSSARKRREGGWLEVHAGGHSTITYIAPWVATSDGYDTLAELHLDEVTVLSSVNDIQILTAASSRISCELPVPLGWNQSRKWVFNVSFQKPTFSIIRDHITLFTDLGKDWSSGPLADFDRWIPMYYAVNISSRDFELTLFLNDHNIITHPHNRNANTLLTLRGTSLLGGIDIPSATFRPQHTTIPFWVEAPGVKFSLTLPDWNTHAMFASSRLTDFGRVSFLRLDASFLYHSCAGPELIDQLKLNAQGRGVVFISFGWVVRHLMTAVRDNYFGNFIHFSTLSEYVDKRNRNLPICDPVELTWKEGKSNVFEVSLNVGCEDSVVVIPAGFQGYEYSLDNPTDLNRSRLSEPNGLGTCIVLKQPEVQLYLRNHDYSMEMSLNTSPVSVSVIEDVVHNLLFDAYRECGGQNLRFDGLNIVANRLYGPQPRTPTYLCMWEIQLGAVSGVISTMELRGISSALIAFRLNLLDSVNAPAGEFASPSDPDVTFLKISVGSVDISWMEHRVSINFALPQGLHIDYNDLAGKTYKKVTEFRVKQGSVRGLLCSDLPRMSWLEAGLISFDVGIDIYSSPQNWKEASMDQVKFVATQDAFTRRASFLYDNTPPNRRSGAPLANRTSTFLPRPNLPRHIPGVPSRTQQTTASSTQAQNRRVDSESEESEYVLEADRDARLAHSRPATPLLFNKGYDSRSISSSDESDDDDVTTAISGSDSDGLEHEEIHIEATDGSLPLFSDYKNAVRRFECHLQDKSPHWHSSLFSLCRDIKPVDGWPPRTMPESSSQGHDQRKVLPQQSDDTDSITQIIRSKSVNVLFTPLLLHIVRQVSDEFFIRAMSMELSIDALTTTYLSDVISEMNTSVPAYKFDVEVSTLQVRILQNLKVVDDTMIPLSYTPSSSHSHPLFPGDSRIISDSKLVFHDFGLTFSRISSRTIPHSYSPYIGLRGSFSRFEAKLDTSPVYKPDVSRKHSPQCTVTIEGSTTAYTFDKSVMTLGTVQVRLFGKASTSLLAATIDSFATVIRTSQQMREDGVAHSVTRRRGLLWSILQCCKDLRVGDPLTQTQPSFLVQVGCPLRLRLDASWKLFMYLRHCLRHLNPMQRQDLQKKSGSPSLLPSVQTNELYLALIARLHEWGNELDLEEVENLPFLKYCFPELNRPIDRVEWHLPSLSFQSRTFTLTVVHHSTTFHEDLDNTISFGPLAIAYRMRKQTTVVPVQTASTTIVPSSSPKATRHHVFTAAVESINLRIHPTFIVFLQTLLHLHGRHIRQALSKSPTSSHFLSSVEVSPDEYWEFFVEISRVCTQAAVESMILEVGFDYASVAIPFLQTSVHSRPQHNVQRDISTKCFLKFSQHYMRVRQAQDKKNPFWSNGRDILTSLVFSSLHLDINCRLPWEHLPTVKGLFILRSAALSVPRSALLTYRLIEEWRTQYLPSISAMTQELLIELKKPRRPQQIFQPPRPKEQWVSLVLDFQVSIKHMGVSLQVMHGTWFSWDVHDIMIYLRNAPGTRHDPRLAFGVQLTSQLIRIGGQSTEYGSSKTIKLVLPSFRSSGNYDGLRLRSHAIIDHFSLTLKPRYMDDILVVQQNLGTHFYDILDVVAENRRNRSTPKKASVTGLKYDVAFMLQGFRVGIVGPTTILDLTSAQMTGTAKNENGLAWDFAVSSLALALSHHTFEQRPGSEFDRKPRSAYMVLDLKASSSPATLDSRSTLSYILRLQIGRMHAVMSPNSIGELGDLIDHFQAEKLLRQEQRAQELEEMKNKTKRVMRTFEVERPTASLSRSTSFLENRTVIINIADIGIAFPLALRDEIEVDPIGSVPAFLMSIQKATFSIRRHESGQASMRRLSLQFIEEFDQSRPSQFDGDRHQSRNKLLYPRMSAEFQSETSTVTRKWQVGAQVDGFVLDLDPSIVDNVFGLMDVYHKGRERVARLTAIPEKTASEGLPAVAVEASYLALKTSRILLMLVFQTGKVRFRDAQPTRRLVAPSSALGPQPLESPKMHIPVGELDDDGSDVIYFPRLTVWGEYRATPAAAKLPSLQDQEPSMLTFRGQLHSTVNQITPSLFPFLAGFSQRIKDRLRNPDTEQFTLEPSFETAPDAASPDSEEFLTSSVWNGIQLSFSLSIDSSRLELLCGHDLGVVAALHWESGGFFVTLSPRVRIAYFAGFVNGLQVDLRHAKHQGGIVQTARVDARNLAFSVSYSQNIDAGILSHSISVVVDTEFGAALRLDRLQDILIFKAIYIDCLPGVVPSTSVKTSSTTEGFSPSRIQGLTAVILLRARHIKLLVDLGHTVASVAINLESLVLRSRIVESMTAVSLSIRKTSFDLEEDRPLSGYVRLPDFWFVTVRRNSLQPGINDGTSKMLNVKVTSGVLDVVLQSEKRTLVQYHASPSDIRISDDWTAIDWNLPAEERTLNLEFSVVGTDVLAIASLQTIPKIINLLAKLKTDLQAQEKEVISALAISSIIRLPRPNNTLSEVAEAMIRSARSKFDDGPVFSYVIVQHMKLKLSNLRFALFKNPNDMEMAMFQGRDVNAELQRVLQDIDAPPTRTLKLAFSALNLSKYSSLKYRVVEDDLMAVSWLERLLKGATEATIARVPAMNLEMNSDVEYEGRQEILQYDLVATAEDRELHSQIYVSLNLSLYIWAGALVKGLSVEIEKALMSDGFHNPVVRTTATAIPSPPALSAPEENTPRNQSAETTILEPTPTGLLAKPATSPQPAAPVHPNTFESDIRLPRRYLARSDTSIDYGTIQQLGEATPDAKAPWLGLKETVPPRVHEYATLPMELLMKMLLEVYIKQLKMATKKRPLEGRESGHNEDARLD